MNALETLIHWMEQQKVSRAVFCAEQKAVFYRDNGTMNGAVWPMEKLHNFAWEILPEKQRAELVGEVDFSCFHQTEHGLYKVMVCHKSLKEPDKLSVWARGRSGAKPDRDHEALVLCVEVEFQTCWFCQTRAGSKEAMLHHKMIWKQVVPGAINIIYWDRKTLEIPRCSYCLFWHGIEFLAASAGLLAFLYLLFFKGAYLPDNINPNASCFLIIIFALLCPFLAWQLPRYLVGCLGILLKFGMKSKVKEHPAHKEAKAQGFVEVIY